MSNNITRQFSETLLCPSICCIKSFMQYLWVSLNSSDPILTRTGGWWCYSYISATNLMSPVWYYSKLIYKKANPTDIKSITFKLPLKILRHHQHWPWCSKERPPCKFRRKTTLLHPSSFAALEEHVVKYPDFNDEIKQSKEEKTLTGWSFSFVQSESMEVWNNKQTPQRGADIGFSPISAWNC